MTIVGPEFDRSSWYTAEQRSEFLAGLANVDTRSHHRFNRDFVACSTAEQGEILTELGAKMLRDAELMKNEPDNYGEMNPRDNFYQTLRSLVLTGYYTSEAGATAELHYETIPSRFDACAEVKTSEEAAKQ